MYFLLFLVVLVIVYVKSFEENFNEEQIQKVTPILISVSAVLFILAILASVISR